ncbi:MAG: metal ABC transporter ATP-binding protein [Lachnospiraceae bacterium]|nr:metal ABC transporter ATP-binding protein [Lachnospiraceae bacterium]
MCCIKVKELGVSFGDERVLENINMHIHCGTMTAIIGKNGGGKSTLVRALLGEVKHTGNIEYRNTGDGNLRQLRIGYVPQKLNIDKTTPMSVYDLFASFCFKVPILIKTKKVTDKIKKALSVFEAEELIDKKIGNLSGGQLQRVLLSIAVYDNPKLLILDEPVSGVDNSGIQLFYDKMQYLRDNYDMAILIVSHDLDFVYKYADKVLLLDNTILADGGPKDVFSTKAFDDMFGGFKLDTDDLENANAKKRHISKPEEPFDASYKGGSHE